MDGDSIMSTVFTDSNIGQRMYDCYPQVISCIVDFQAIIKAEYPEFEEMSLTRDKVIENSYLSTMDEARIANWEKVLKIVPLPNSTVEDRRDVISARLRGQGKLNTNVINTIVNTFTGGSANSWVEDSTLFVEITPSPTNKQYRFENIEQELKNKVPCHLGLNVFRNYYTWGEVNDTSSTWSDVKTNFGTWENVYLFVASTYRG
jgi:hypothetical protein